MSIRVTTPHTGRTWLDRGGYFLFGKYQNSLAQDIAQDDPCYIKWILENVVDMCDEDREILLRLINRKRG